MSRILKQSKTITPAEEVPEETEGPELYYEIKAQNGDVYITINAGRGSKVKMMSGKPQPWPKP